jgi:hypothetical protein
MKFISSLALLVVCASSSNALVTPIRQSVVSTTAKVAPRRSSLTLVAENSLRGGAEGEQVGTGTATIPNEVFNLVKSIVGAGVLSLPAGKYNMLIICRFQ